MIISGEGIDKNNLVEVDPEIINETKEYAARLYHSFNIIQCI